MNQLEVKELQIKADEVINDAMKAMSVLEKNKLTKMLVKIHTMKSPHKNFMGPILPQKEVSPVNTLVGPMPEENSTLVQGFVGPLPSQHVAVQAKDFIGPLMSESNISPKKHENSVIKELSENKTEQTFPELDSIKQEMLEVINQKVESTEDFIQKMKAFNEASGLRVPGARANIDARAISLAESLVVGGVAAAKGALGAGASIVQSLGEVMPSLKTGQENILINRIDRAAKAYREAGGDKGAHMRKLKNNLQAFKQHMGSVVERTDKMSPKDWRSQSKWLKKGEKTIKTLESMANNDQTMKEGLHETIEAVKKLVEKVKDVMVGAVAKKGLEQGASNKR